MDIVLLCEQRMIFCSLVLLTLPGIYCSPFDKPKSTKDHWSSCCFHSHAFSIPISRSLYPESFSTIFKEEFRSIGIDILMSRHVLSGLFDFISLSLWIGISQSLCFLGFAVTVTDSYVYSIYRALGSCRVCIICPLEICCSFVVSLYVLCLGKFRTSRDKVVNCFLKLPANSAHSVSVIFLNPVSVVVGL